WQSEAMNKRVIIVVLALVVLIGGAVSVYAATRPGATPAAQTSTDQTSTSSTPPAAAPAPSASPTDAAAETDAAASGVYVDYSPTAIADAEGRALLFFHAPWCPQCRSVEADILSEGVPAGVTIIKVDYDSHQDLRQQYGVTLQTTFVEVDSSGAGLQTYVAYDDPHLQAVIDAML
ncbi:MAG TPA: thioredoxin family protein, partial [Rhodoglobus sp.]|nr:thioredoxin family protein [Rhodoglobus sp.]